MQSTVKGRRRQNAKHPFHLDDPGGTKKNTSVLSLSLSLSFQRATAIQSLPGNKLLQVQVNSFRHDVGLHLHFR